VTSIVVQIEIEEASKLTFIMKYRCVIVDDEPLAHQVLLHHIRCLPQLEMVQQCFSAAAAMRYLCAQPPDILLLDIEMPEQNGLSLLQLLPQKPVTIVTTAFLQYSLEGFELGVMDYLVKPVRFERLERAVNRATEFLDLLRLKADIERTAEQTGSLLIKTGKRQTAVSRASITHVQALKDYVIIYTTQHKYVIRSTMKEMEALLGGAFLRVHKSFIVAKNRIQFLTAFKIEFDGLEIPVGRSYRKAVEEALRGGAGL
jgi:DNA-binding LytR/AlgR family response regulator